MPITTLVKTATAIGAVAVGVLVAPGTAGAAVATDPYCDTSRGIVAGNGWSVTAPTATHRTGTTSQSCYLRYADRSQAVQQLKGNLRHCYGIALNNSAVYDAATKATESTNCYRPFASRSVRADLPAGAYSPDCRAASGLYVGNGWWIGLPAAITRTAATSFGCYLKPGDRGAGVEQLQRALQDCYRATLPATSVYDSRTRATIAAVQRLHKITADGIYGPVTSKAMYWRMSSHGRYSETCYSPL